MINPKIKAATYFIVVALTITFSSELCLADLYSGSLSVNGGGIYATDGWNNNLTTISWTVTPIVGGYNYSYTFTVPDDTKELSHIIFEVSENFTDSDFLSSISYDLDTFGSGNDNPGIPGNIYGIKFDIPQSEEGEEGYSWTLTFDTTRMPRWGDFYAKDGVYNPQGAPSIDVYAYNTSFGLPHTDNSPYHIAVPDTYVPVPPAVLLGMLGIGIAGIKLRKYA